MAGHEGTGTSAAGWQAPWEGRDARDEALSADQ